MHRIWTSSELDGVQDVLQHVDGLSHVLGLEGGGDGGAGGVLVLIVGDELLDGGDDQVAEVLVGHGLEIVQLGIGVIGLIGIVLEAGKLQVPLDEEQILGDLIPADVGGLAVLAELTTDMLLDQSVGGEVVVDPLLVDGNQTLNDVGGGQTSQGGEINLLDVEVEAGASDLGELCQTSVDAGDDAGVVLFGLGGDLGLGCLIVVGKPPAGHGVDLGGLSGGILLEVDDDVTHNCVLLKNKEFF